VTEEEFIAEGKPIVSPKMTEEEFLARHPTKGKQLSAAGEKVGAADVLRSGNRVGESLLKEAEKPEFALRNNPATMVPTALYQTVTNPHGEGDRARAAFNALSLGGMAKLSGHPEDYRKAAEDYPAESIAGGSMLPGGAEIQGLKGVLARPAIQSGYGALGAYFSGGDPKSGAVMGGLTGGVAEGVGAPARAAGPLKKAAEENAWKAAQGVPGISDVAKRMGYKTEQDIRDAGRKFLDKGLVRAGDTSGDIADRARKLEAQADNAADSILTKAELSGRKFDYADALGDAEKSMRSPKLSAAGEDNSGPAKRFLDQIARQDAITPGSYLGARKLKSDAYRSVNWDDEAPLSAELHRKSTLGLRDNLEKQVGQATSPADAKAMHDANQDFSIAADAEALGDRGARRQAGHQLNVSGLLGRLGIVGAASAHNPKEGMGAGLAVLADYLTKHRQASALARGEDLASKLGARMGVLQKAGQALPAAERTNEMEGGPRTFAEWLAMKRDEK
jgi:hypothetical protein